MKKTLSHYLLLTLIMLCCSTSNVNADIKELEVIQQELQDAQRKVQELQEKMALLRKEVNDNEITVGELETYEQFKALRDINPELQKKFRTLRSIADTFKEVKDIDPITKKYGGKSLLHLLAQHSVSDYVFKDEEVKINQLTWINERKKIAEERKVDVQEVKLPRTKVIEADPQHKGKSVKDYIRNVMTELLDRGLDVNVRDDHGATPLHEVARVLHTSPDLRHTRGEAEVRFLLERRANINAANNQGDTVLHELCNQPTGLPLPALFWLDLKGIDVNLQNKFGFTALHFIVSFTTLPQVEYERNNIGIMVRLNVTQKLLEKGAKLTIQDDQGETIFHVLVRYLKLASLGYDSKQKSKGHYNYAKDFVELIVNYANEHNPTMLQGALALTNVRGKTAYDLRTDHTRSFERLIKV